MAEKRYVVHVSVLLGISVVLMLFIFALVGHHHDTPDRARMNQGALLSSGSSVDARISPVARVEVANAEPRMETEKIAATSSPALDGQQVYKAACVACHGTGVAGAPKLGDKGLWAMRIGKGANALYRSALNGIQSSTGAMPAKGGNPALSEAEVKAAVDYMMAQSK